MYIWNFFYFFEQCHILFSLITFFLCLDLIVFFQIVFCVCGAKFNLYLLIHI